ncbi:hypothetical protein BMS3Abin16_01558 [archaeon BMS3Abin16]|nr:hypothetical protein BMS3Abin16_01558 [archaeon BMS3Abin16]GBE56112.1 hypothetical protein BMS3Bbin16_00311 [archaeon BMS3Bbin16]HDY73664.1 hypothetical protein [Euryarchaeota archaeon]
MTECPQCQAVLSKEIEKVYEIGDVKYFDIRLNCTHCGFQKPLTVSRKNPVPRAPDAATEIAASLKFRDYLPRRIERQSRKGKKRSGDLMKTAFNPVKQGRDLIIYGGAIILGLGIELVGFYFEGSLQTIRIDPLAGFLLSLLIFIFAPILIVGSAVYYVTRDRLKAVLLGSIAVPLTIIILANLRLEQWGL